MLDESIILKNKTNKLSKMFLHLVGMPPFVNSQFFIMRNVKRIENVRIQILILNIIQMYQRIQISRLIFSHRIYSNA